MAGEFTVDLDAARAARREAQKQQPQVVLGGHTYVLPYELPLEASLRLAEMPRDETSAAKAIMEIVKVLLGDQMEAFMANDLSGDDLEAFLKGILPLYGFGDVGESSASESSSPKASRPSRQSSNGPTGLTSAIASGAPSP